LGNVAPKAGLNPSGATAADFEDWKQGSRSFRESESENARVAVLSNALWRARFPGASDVAGRMISLGGRNYTVVGVMPDDFDYPPKFGFPCSLLLPRKRTASLTV
jgi:hypothetical protein